MHFLPANVWRRNPAETRLPVRQEPDSVVEALLAFNTRRIPRI